MTGAGSIVGFTCRLVTTLDALVDLFAMHRDVLWRVDANAHLVALDSEDGHRHGITDHQGFTDAASQDQHLYPPLTGRPVRWRVLSVIETLTLLAIGKHSIQALL